MRRYRLEVTDVIGVIVVDDHEAVRSGIAEVLRAEPDISVLGTAGDGAAALEAAHRLRPDVVLMDVTMPVMDGVTATERLRGARVEVRVLIVSSAACGTTVHAARDAGAAGYLLKSGDPVDLAAAVRAVAAGGEWWCTQAEEALRHGR